jgi:hypothetical protein
MSSVGISNCGHGEITYGECRERRKEGTLYTTTFEV